MATLQKFYTFVGDVGTKVHNLNSDTLKILLTDTAPNHADTVVDTTTSTCTVKSTSNAAEIAAGNGYSKGGTAVGSNAYSQSSGTATLTGNAVTFTATGGAIAQFRYVVLYNNSAGTTSTRPVIGWWDYGSEVNLNSGESFTVAADTSGSNWSSGSPILSIA
jgi:hypothetical protein